MAERADEADAELARLESDAAGAEREKPELVERAACLADDLRDRPRIAETAQPSQDASSRTWPNGRVRPVPRSSWPGLR